MVAEETRPASYGSVNSSTNIRDIQNPFELLDEMKQGSAKVKYFCPSKATIFRNIKQNVSFATLFCFV
jgi:hypothetical protein